MNCKSHYRNLVLSVLVLILPSLLVAWLGWTNIGYANEKQKADAKTIADTALDSERAEIGNLIWKRLDGIMSQGIANGGAFDDPAVKFVAWVDGERVVLPWEQDPNSRLYSLAINEEAFAVEKLNAERAERERPPDHAIDLYAALSQSAPMPEQRAYARLRLAAVQRQTGRTVDASSTYRELLNLPWNVVNDDGDSFASIAAVGLVDTAPRLVLVRVAQDLESPSALTLEQARRWREVLEPIAGSSDAALRADAKTANETLSDRIASLELAKKDLKQDADLLALRNEVPKSLSEKAWLPYGSDLLISRAPAGATLRPLLIAVRRDSIFQSVRASRGTGASFEIVADGTSGKPLDAQRLPRLNVVLSLLPAAGTAFGPDLQLTFYAGLLLVVSLNLFGGYLLWRDTRREARLSELRSQFVSSVSHELKTPLTSIRMFAEILQMGSVPDARTRDECLDTIVNESERLTRLLNNVLDFSRIEQGQKTYQMAPTHLADVVHSAAKTMHYPLAEQGFALSLNVDDGMPPVDVDPDALKQAVLNLLTNAMKYSGRSRTIELRLFPENGDAMIQVEDHGIGISESEQSRIFERYYRAQVAENGAISGTGLGLALVAHIAEAHGGRVQVESSLGVGSTFSIRLPAHAGGVA
jgi:signal transduction histidine kinase